MILACHGDTVTDITAPIGLALAISPATDTIFIGDTLTSADTVQLHVSATTQDGVVPVPAGREFASQDPTVANVDSAGVVQALGIGTADITVRVNGVRAHATVVVLHRVHVVTLSAPAPQLLVGDTMTLAPKAFDWHGAPVPGRVFGYTAEPQIAAVLPVNRLVFASPGTATITAYTSGVSGGVSITALPRAFVGGASGSLSSGRDATCGLLPLGRAYCFGVKPLTGVARDTSCFDDRPSVSGSNPESCTLVPMPIALDLQMRAVSVGDSVACGLSVAGRAYCWGDDTYGEIGDGVAMQPTSLKPSPVTGPLGVALTFSEISAGGTHVCALTLNGSAYCWGNDSTYQLGGGDHRVVNSTTPIPIASGASFSSISAGDAHTCALRAGDGAAVCWGSDSHGQLGLGTSGDTADVPTAIPGVSFTQISAGADHTCALTAAGSVYCWGGNQYGQSGQSNASIVTSPTQVAGSGYVQVSAGTEFTCALTGAGQVYCWGRNDYGQLGRGAGTANAPAFDYQPTAAAQGALAFNVVSAGSRTACAVAPDGAYCWGSAVLGATGNEIQALSVPFPTKTATPQ